MSDLTTLCGHVTWTEYSDVCVMWKETCPHQRGNFIHGYMYRLAPDDSGSVTQSNCNTSRSVVVGKDACSPGDNRPVKYCDGPLDPGTKYSISAMVCTRAGCSATTVVDNITTPG
ncbi:hypothetical protein C0Q70_11882 [Pomacea canaliculata]|uniref:protein-tyrosine-phosphatase n=1 Tax=Pomacea canaliculata TaxID=400727 RepID=A0A2T7P774_POMCA|nr:hypothetical protein C0Q70_11882 [Pomacea canaliculata]